MCFSTPAGLLPGFGHVSGSACAEGDKTDSQSSSKVKKALKTPEAKPAPVVMTPARHSARIAAKAITDAFSDNETKKVKVKPNPELPDAQDKKKGWSFQWLMALPTMVLVPAILVYLQML